jgi:hypothetical protein
MRVKVGGGMRWMKRKAKGGEGERIRKERLFGRESHPLSHSLAHRVPQDIIRCAAPNSRLRCDEQKDWIRINRQHRMLHMQGKRTHTLRQEHCARAGRKLFTSAQSVQHYVDPPPI